jgi:hypothetical protein
MTTASVTAMRFATFEGTHDQQHAIWQSNVQQAQSEIRSQLLDFNTNQ